MIWKWILGIAAVPLGVAAIVAGIGALLPREHVARGDRLVAASPEQVAATIRAVEAYPRWRSGVERIERVERHGSEVRFVEHSGGGAIAFALVEEQTGRRFRSTITDPDLPFGGFWTIALESAGERTRVTIEEHGFVGNPIFRFVSALVFGHEATLRTYLDDLERRWAGES
jgi:hypothetical protein